MLQPGLVQGCDDRTKEQAKKVKSHDVGLELFFSNCLLRKRPSSLKPTWRRSSWTFRTQSKRPARKPRQPGQLFLLFSRPTSSTRQGRSMAWSFRLSWRIFDSFSKVCGYRAKRTETVSEVLAGQQQVHECVGRAEEP